MAILNKYKKKWQTGLQLRKDNYYDFVLSLNNESSVPLNGKLTTRCLSSYIDVENKDCLIDGGGLISSNKYSYANAVNNGLELRNIGFTGVDTSLVKFDKDSITEDEFTNILLNSKLTLASGDTRLELTPVSGNTKQYEYPCELIENSGETLFKSYYKFNGGFLQGFYKACDSDYEVLPQYIQDAWCLEFVLRPRSDYEKNSGKTLNDEYPDNEGIFFYIGTRAENKFVEYYGVDLSEFPLRNKEKTGETTYPVVETNAGHVATSNDEKDIETDNAYLIYDRTCEGYTTDTWKQGDKIIIRDNRNYTDENLYPIMNRTCTGQTTDTLDRYIEENRIGKSNKYNVKKDIYSNAFALKITDDGSIGYKYLIKDCDSEKGYSVKEETGFKDTVVYNQWNVVNIVFKILNGTTDDCGIPLGQRKMKMFIYVNGYLKFVSQELPEFNFVQLNDYCDKQEGVAYNLSIGGGNQGLIESVWYNKYDGSEHIFPIEANFAGSFIGDIASFKFYNCQLQYTEILNNYLFEIGGEESGESMVKDNIIYYGFNINPENVIVEGKQISSIGNGNRTLYPAISDYDDARFYVVYSKKFNGLKPVQFTCGGAPMVMYQTEITIDKKPCVVWTSGEICAPETTLTIISDNL